MKLEIRKCDMITYNLKLILISTSSIATSVFIFLLAIFIPEKWNLDGVVACGVIISIIGLNALVFSVAFIGFFLGKTIFKYAEGQLIIENTVCGLTLHKKTITPKTVTRITFNIKANDPLVRGLGGRAGRGGHSIPTYDIAIVADKKSQLIFSSDMEAPSRKVFDTLSEWFGWERRDSVSRTKQNTNHQ